MLISKLMKNLNLLESPEYTFHDEHVNRRAAVQCWTNLCVSELQVKRCEGDNDKVIFFFRCAWKIFDALL